MHAASQATGASFRRVSQYRLGFLAAVGAYFLWGLFPLYWPLLEPAKPVEILAHRMAWSLIFLVVVLATSGGFRWARTLGARRARLLALAAVLVTINWGTFIYAVNSHHVVEVSLGYFINPLVTVALAVVVLSERLRARQWVAVGIAAAGVVVLAVDYGRPPWIALTVAFSFGFYGLIKNRVGIGGIQSLAVETAVLFPVALAYIVALQLTGGGTLTSEGGGHVALLALGGPVTAIPLMLFGAAAVRIPLSTIGILQYLGPIIQFGIGVGIRGEPMPPARLAGFALVWVAIIAFMGDALRAPRPLAAETV